MPDWQWQLADARFAFTKVRPIAASLGLWCFMHLGTNQEYKQKEEGAEAEEDGKKQRKNKQHVTSGMERTRKWPVWQIW